MHWPDPAQQPRIAEIRDNLLARIAEAEHEGWLGEVEGRKFSLAGAEDKLAQLDRRSNTNVELGIPSVGASDQGAAWRSQHTIKLRSHPWRDSKFCTISMNESRGRAVMTVIIGLIGAIVGGLVGAFVTYLTTRSNMRLTLEHSYDQTMQGKRLELYQALFQITKCPPRYWPPMEEQPKRKDLQQYIQDFHDWLQCPGQVGE